MGNELKRAIKAPARAASTRLVIVWTCSCTIGAIRMEAIAASADPSAQLRVAMRSGDSPTEEAARWFSATAVVAKPKVE